MRGKGGGEKGTKRKSRRGQQRRLRWQLLKLKQQLSAEKKRSEVLEEQVTEWKNKFKQLGPGAKPPPS